MGVPASCCNSGLILGKNTVKNSLNILKKMRATVLR